MRPRSRGSADEPVAFHRDLAGHGLLGLADLLIDAAQGAAVPVVPVLVVNDLVAAAAARPGRPRLGEDLPVGEVLAGARAATTSPHSLRGSSRPG